MAVDTVHLQHVVKGQDHNNESERLLGNLGQEAACVISTRSRMKNQKPATQKRAPNAGRNV